MRDIAIRHILTAIIAQTPVDNSVPRMYIISFPYRDSPIFNYPDIHPRPKGFNRKKHLPSLVMLLPCTSTL